MAQYDCAKRISPLNSRVAEHKLVLMTRISKTDAGAVNKTKAGGRQKVRLAHKGRWLLQDAKARFSELVRRAKSDGPQLVTVHGREGIFVVAADEFRRLKGEATGQALI